MLYKLLGLATWKAIRSYVRRKQPGRAAVGVGVAAGVALLGALAAARARGERP